MMIVEDDPDVRLLVKVSLQQDPRIEINGESSSAEEAIEHCRVRPPGLVILDHMQDGDLSGLQAKAEPAIDEFLLKTKFVEPLPTCQGLVGLDPVA